jgi:hypothetical protein
MYVCDDDFRDDDFVIGQKLANLASSRQLLKDQMFRQIVQFRENRKNGIRKLAQLKDQFQKTFLQLTCTGDVHDATMKKKCGKLWACIEYAIYEFVDISSFSCSHVERMRDKHNAWLLEQKGNIESLRGKVPVVEQTDTLLQNSLKFSDASESVVERDVTVQRPLDDPVSASRKSDRQVKPARSSGSETGKHQTYPKMM